jgi:hypothetical protein
MFCTMEDAELKIVKEEKKDYSLPDVPTPPGGDPEDLELQVPELVQRNAPIINEVSLDKSKVSAKEYISAEVKKIDVLLGNNLVIEARKAFNDLNKFMGSIKLEEKFKKLIWYDIKRLESAISLSEI